MATAKKEAPKAKGNPGEERFVSSGKSVVLLKPGRGAKNGAGGGTGTGKKGKK